MRKLLIVGLIGLLLVAAGACRQKENASGEEDFQPKELITGDKKTEADSRQPTVVVAGDVVVVELTVYHPAYVYLTGESPVTVMAPVDEHCVFEQSLFPMTVARFPMEVRFSISPKADPASFQLRLGLKVNYAYKSNDEPVFKNTLVNVPLKIVPIAEGHTPRTIRIPLDHFLSVAENVEEKTEEKAAP